MTADVLGKAVSDATLFLRAIHDDLRSQIRSSDRLMADRGWKPVDRNRVGYGLGNSLSDGKKWVLEYLQRCYVRNESDGTADRLVAVVWSLYADAGDPYEAATVMAVAAHFSIPAAVATFLTNEWNNAPVYAAVGRSVNPVPLTLDQVHPLFPSATSAAGFVTPLCELTGESDLLTRLIDPILAAESQLTGVVRP